MILATCSSTNTDQPSPSEGSSSSSRRHRKKPYKSWLKDGVNGGPCSMQVVVRWLSANYTTKWRDDSDNRMPKKLLLQEILDQLQQVGIHHRLAKDVASKISTLQSNYRTAREWYDVIGSQWRKAGALETDVKKEVLRRFPYWDELHEVFGATGTTHSTHTTITTTTTTTTTKTAEGNVSSTSTMTTMTTHNSNIAGWPMSIRSIIHSVDEEDDGYPPSSPYYAFQPQDTTLVKTHQQQQAAATAAVAAATAQATAATATATTTSIISLSNNSQAVIVSTATTTDNAMPPMYEEEDACSSRSGSSSYSNEGSNDAALLRKRRLDEEFSPDPLMPEDGQNYERLLAEEREKTRRVRARVDLVKRLVKSGSSKEEIAEQLRSIM